MEKIKRFDYLEKTDNKISFKGSVNGVGILIILYCREKKEEPHIFIVLCRNYGSCIKVWKHTFGSAAWSALLFHKGLNVKFLN